MNANPRSLDRLLRAAAAAPHRATTPLSCAAEARILAAWRQPGEAWDGFVPVSFFRRGLALTGALAALALALSLWQFQKTPTDEWRLPTTVFNLASMQ